MCLHIDLKYDRTITRTNTDGGGSWDEEVRVYKCQICKKEFEIYELDWNDHL